MVEIVRSGMAYREQQKRQIIRTEIEAVNGHILELGFRFPDLWDHEFLRSLEQTTAERAHEHFAQETFQQAQKLKQQQHIEHIEQLKEWFLRLAAEGDRNKAGLTLEKLLNRLFELFGLRPRQPFRVTGEQIDGSFELDGQTYLVESKWKKNALSEAELLIFRGKIEGKSTFTRGVFIALDDITGEARDAITRGKPPSFFVMNGYDLMMILSGNISLIDFLQKRRRLLAEEGRVCVPFSELK